jgi:hypothetical protein
VTADSVIRLVPPLILTTAEADEIVAILTPLVKAVSGAISQPATESAMKALPAVQPTSPPTNTPTCSSAPRSSRSKFKAYENTTRWPTARWP